MPVARGGLIVVQQVFLLGIWLNALLAFFNVIPIPPLDGSHILYHFLPPHMAKQYRELSRYGFLILLALMILFRDYFFLLLLPAVWVTRFAIDLLGPLLLQGSPF